MRRKWRRRAYEGVKGVKGHNGIGSDYADDKEGVLV